MLKSPARTVDVSNFPSSVASFCFMYFEISCKVHRDLGLFYRLGELLLLSCGCDDVCSVFSYP